MEKKNVIESLSLNPCCNGIYSMSAAIPMLAAGIAVLILVVMEYTQWDYEVLQTISFKIRS